VSSRQAGKRLSAAKKYSHCHAAEVPFELTHGELDAKKAQRNPFCTWIRSVKNNVKACFILGTSTNPDIVPSYVNFSGSTNRCGSKRGPQGLFCVAHDFALLRVAKSAALEGLKQNKMHMLSICDVSQKSSNLDFLHDCSRFISCALIPNLLIDSSGHLKTAPIRSLLRCKINKSYGTHPGSVFMKTSAF
jgi:hypothetical protein